MEATFASKLDPTKRGTVKLRGSVQVPLFCPFSRNSNGLCCYNGVIVLSETHGSMKLQNYIEKRNLTSALEGIV